MLAFAPDRVRKRQYWGVLSPICSRYQLNADFFNTLTPSLQHHLALTCSAISLSGAVRPVLGIFVTLSLVNTRAKQCLAGHCA
jgi:hypothetical protein